MKQNGNGCEVTDYFYREIDVNKKKNYEINESKIEEHDGEKSTHTHTHVRLLTVAYAVCNHENDDKSQAKQKLCFDPFFN